MYQTFSIDDDCAEVLEYQQVASLIGTVLSAVGSNVEEKHSTNNGSSAVQRSERTYGCRQRTHPRARISHPQGFGGVRRRAPRMDSYVCRNRSCRYSARSRHATETNPG